MLKRTPCWPTWSGIVGVWLDTDILTRFQQLFSKIGYLFTISSILGAMNDIFHVHRSCSCLWSLVRSCYMCVTGRLPRWLSHSRLHHQNFCSVCIAGQLPGWRVQVSGGRHAVSGLDVPGRPRLLPVAAPLAGRPVLTVLDVTAAWPHTHTHVTVTAMTTMSCRGGATVGDSQPPAAGRRSKQQRGVTEDRRKEGWQPCRTHCPR